MVFLVRIQSLNKEIILVFISFNVDFYEEILTLIDTLTINTVSPLMWQVFYLIKEAFFRDAADYFAGKIIFKMKINKLVIFSFL